MTDELLVVYGRQPVLEALADPAVLVEEVLVSRSAPQAEVLDAAGRRGVPVRRVTPEKVGRVSGNPRDDQGVVASVRRPSPAPLTADVRGPVLVLDGVTNPANVGMILRAAVAFDVGAVVLPRAGTPALGPLVVKASAGVALHAPVRRCDTAGEAVALLRDADYRVYGLSAGAGTPLWSTAFADRVALVLGNETHGVSVDVDASVAIPMAGGVESLNVAVAAGVVCYELARRRSASRPPSLGRF